MCVMLYFLLEIYCSTWEIMLRFGPVIYDTSFSNNFVQMTSLGIAPAINGDMDGEFVIGVTDTLTVRASQIRSEVCV